jgi:hypothetical protein
MNKETTLRLHGHDIRLQFSNPDDWSAEGMGRSCLISSRILLREGMPNSTQACTLLHELAHQIFGIAGMSEHDSEIVVSVVAAGMLDFMRSNPDIVNAIVKSESIEELVTKHE